jgi:hypothetical protein
MFVRGSNNATEYKRNDTNFYKGIVVKNWDPQKLYRIKVYIPELSNQPLEDWLKEYKSFNMRFPGTNNENDVWKDAKIFEEISKFLPYAEPCFPILGESGIGRYQSPEELAVISDTNYESEFETNNTEPPNSSDGSFGPSYLYETLGNSVQDAFASPLNNFSGSNNPYSLQYRPSKHSNKAKGVFGLPAVGSQVWLFHYRGDINFPVYIGSRVDFRQTVLMTDSDNEDQQTFDYPGIFENLMKQGDE